MTEKEMIEEMAEIIFNSKYKNDYISPLKGANELYNAGYRKIPEGSVVYTKEDQEDMKISIRHEIYCECNKTRKETAKEILKEILLVESVDGWQENKQLVDFSNKIVDKIEKLAKQYEVEIEE